MPSLRAQISWTGSERGSAKGNGKNSKNNVGVKRFRRNGGQADMACEGEVTDMDQTGENLMVSTAGTAAGLRRAQISAEYAFMMPKDSRIIAVTEEAYRSYVESAKVFGAQREHTPPRLHRAPAVFKELVKVTVSPGIEAEHKTLKKRVVELQELSIAEACVQVRQCHYTEVKDHNTNTNQVKAHRLHLRFEAIAIANQNKSLTAN
jgi:hypothetical protein